MSRPPSSSATRSGWARFAPTVSPIGNSALEPSDDPVGVLGGRDLLQRTLPAMAGTAASATLRAIASRDLTRAERAVASFPGARAHASYEALLADPEIDAVYSSMPNTLHLEWCVRALEAADPWCAGNRCARRQGHRASDLARDKSGKHIEEAFSYRNHPQWRALESLIQTGAIGAPVSARHVGQSPGCTAPPDHRQRPEEKPDNGVNRNLLVLPGDGIGPEVMNEVRKIIAWMGRSARSASTSRKTWSAAPRSTSTACRSATTP